MLNQVAINISIPESRRSLVKWGGWFAGANIILMCIIGLRYLFIYSWPVELDARFYAIIAFLGQFSLLAYLPYLLFVVPTALLLPRKKVVFPVAVFIASISLAMLLLDSLLFAENKFHINALSITILGWKTWGFGLFYLFIITVFESMLAGWIWRKFAAPDNSIKGVLFGLFLFTCLLLSQLQYIWADAHYYVPITRFHHYLPLYYRWTAKRLLTRYGLVDINQVRERQLVEKMADTHASDLNYPLHPMACNPPHQPMNVLLVLADALRADVITPEITPNIVKVGNRNIMFTQHYSGGNSSRIGIFSLFYGLSNSYFESVKTQQQSALLIDLLQNFHYQLGIFTSSSLVSPTGLDRTVFARVPNLRKETKAADPTGPTRDKQATHDWYEWLDKRNVDKPFFGFLFYDSTHTYQTPPDYPNPFKPMDNSREQVEYTAYKNSAHFVDSLIADVLQDLQQRKLLKKTVVMISSDHGEEFNEKGNGYWNHGTSYSNYQIHTPMIVLWPGKSAKQIQNRTSHYDVVPTLLTEVLNCTNPASDYSVGKNLFNGEDWPWLIVGSYDTEAVVEPEQITITYPGGYFEIRDRNYNEIDNPSIHAEVISDAMKAMGRFYK
jgi:uncharacterized protein